MQKVQSALISSLEIGDEKLQLVQSMQDVVENKSRQLETDCKTLGKFLFIDKPRMGLISSSSFSQSSVKIVKQQIVQKIILLLTIENLVQHQEGTQATLEKEPKEQGELAQMYETY